MKLLMMVKDINVKSLTSGDKSGRITLETLYPNDVSALALLADKMEIEIDFKLTNESKKDSIKTTG